MPKKTYEVIDGPLSVRLEPGGQWLKSYPTGHQFVADNDSKKTVNGYEWIEHDEGWSAHQSVDKSSQFLKKVNDEPAPQNAEPESKTVHFKTNRQVRVRQSPTLAARHLRWLDNNERIQTTSDSRTEADGYIWWQHHEGWSASQSLDDRWIFMAEVEIESDPTSSEPATELPSTPESEPEITAETVSTATAIPAAPAPSVFKLQAKTEVRIRSEPDLSAPFIKWLPQGTVVELNASSEVTNDGYIWLHHQDGWSAWKNVSGSVIFLVEPGSVEGVAVMTDDGPDPTTLPYLKSLVKNMPIDVNSTHWFQYFGNNVYAYKHGNSWGYDRYAQGLHSGLDFGNNDSYIPVYASSDCTFVHEDRYGIRAKNGSYTFIYQHLTNTTSFHAGQQIAAGTKIGELDASSPRLRHLHFEIRYKGSWIVNPLLFMADDMVYHITGKYNPSHPIYFHKSGAWNQWVTPLDQPVIKLGGPVVGPTAG